MKNYSLLLIQIIFMILISIPEVECQELEVLGNVKVQNGNEGEGKILVSDEFGSLEFRMTLLLEKTMKVEFYFILILLIFIPLKVLFVQNMILIVPALGGAKIYL